MLTKILILLVGVCALSCCEALSAHELILGPFRQNVPVNKPANSHTDDAAEGASSRSKRGDDPYPTIEITMSMREEYLKLFNGVRQKVHPPASNMYVMKWNEELANFAWMWASTCSPSIPPDLSHMEASYFISPRSEDLSNLMEQKRARLQSGEDMFDYDSLSCSGDCSYYVKRIWHDLSEVGCSIASCDHSPFEDKYFEVCLFPFQANIYDGSGEYNFNRPYAAGYPCSECDCAFPICDSEYSMCPNNMPYSLEFVVEPGPEGNPAGQPFGTQPVLMLLDENGYPYTGLANPGCPWYIGVIYAYGSHPHAELIGKREVPVIDGYANFTDLGINELGEYKLYFFVSYPTIIIDLVEFLVCTDTILISPPLDTMGICLVEEGEPRFERSYEWGEECSSVCVRDCSGQHRWHVELDTCGPHAECMDSECVCDKPMHFGYDIFDEDYLEQTVWPELYCMPNYIEMRLNKCGMNALGYYLGDLYVLGPGGMPVHFYPGGHIDEQIFPFIQSCAYNDCRGFVTADARGLAYSFVIEGNFADCNGLVDSNMTHITYTHTVRGFGGWTNGIISRQRPIAVEFTCAYVRRMWTSTEIAINPFIHTVTLEITSEGEFTISMAIMKDHTYMQAYTKPPMIMVPDDIYVEVILIGLDPDTVTLYAHRCYATPTNNRTDSVSVPLIENGCPAMDGAQNPHSTIAKNGETGGMVLFSFESFVFLGFGDSCTMYIHCEMHVCTQDPAPCSTSCSSRRRRAATLDSETDSFLTLGPINISSTGQRKKRDAESQRYSDSFSSEYSAQEVANPPFARTSGRGSFSVSFQ